MAGLRAGLISIAGYDVKRVIDYSQGIAGLPKSNVLKYFIANGSIVARPSGTEPKLKIYISVLAADQEAAAAVENKISQAMAVYME